MAGFVDGLLSNKVDFKREIVALNNLSNSRHFWPVYGTHSFLEMAGMDFLSWPSRGFFVSLPEAAASLGIDDIVTQAYASDAKITLEQFLSYLEFLLNMSCVVSGDSEDRVVKSIITTINTCLESMHYFSSNVGSKGVLVRISPKDPALEKAVETTRSEPLADLFYSYVHHDTKGDIAKKSMILTGIWKSFEPIREDVKKQNAALAKEIGKLANSYDIRHAPDDEEKVVLDKLSPKQKEDLLDHLFDLFVDAFATYKVPDEIKQAEDILLSAKV